MGEAAYMSRGPLKALQQCDELIKTGSMAIVRGTRIRALYSG